MAATAKQESIGVVTPPIPSYDAPAMGIALVFEAVAPLPSDHALRQRIAHVRAFWSTLRVRPISCSQERGSTWLELFVLFAISGGTACAAPAEHLRQSHAKQLNAFRNISRLFFRFASAETRPLLKPNTMKSRASGWPLAHYGIQAKLPSLPFQLALGGDVAKQLHAALCAYSARVPNVSHIPGKLRSARFRPPKFAPWEHLVFGSHPLQGIAKRYISSCERQSNKQSFDIEKGAARSLWLSCPKCSATRDVRNLTLQRDDRTMAIRCKTCKHTCTSHKWQCPCGMVWSACPACRPRGFACRAPMRAIKRDRPVQCISADVPDWVPRAGKRVKRVPLPSSRNTKLLVTPARATAAYPLPPPAATTTHHTRERDPGGAQPSSKRRLLFVPGNALASKFPKLAESHSQGV